MRASLVVMACAMACVMLSGCASLAPPQATPQPVAVQGAWSRAPAEAMRGAAQEAAQEAAPAPWWLALPDPQLHALITAALQASPDQAIAAARVAQARASVAAARAAARPTLGLSSSAERQGSARRQIGQDSAPSGRLVNKRLGLDAQGSWEIDLFGRNDLALAGAQAESASSEQDAAGMRAALVAEVIDNYIELALAEALTRIADDEADWAAQSLAAEQRRLAAGLVSSRALRARIETRDQALRAADAARTQRALAEGRIALLVGQAAHRFIAQPAAASLLDVEPTLAGADPAAVIGRRADVQAAWQRVLAASADTERARLERYPRLTLSTGAGFAAESLRRWLERDALSWVLGLRVALPLWEGGRVQAQVDLANATAQEKHAEYRRVVLTALQQVEAGLAMWELARDGVAQAHATLARRTQNQAQAQREMDAGRIARDALADAARARLQAAEELARTQRALLQSATALHRAFGEGA